MNIDKPNDGFNSELDNENERFVENPISQSNIKEKDKTETRNPMTPSEELTAIIEERLQNVCADNLPRLCNFCKEEVGRETATNMIFEYCMAQGVSVQTAMAHIDSELT